MENRNSLVVKITAFVQERHGGDWRRAFDVYATNGKLTRDGLDAALQAAGVGPGYLGRKLAEVGIMEVADADGDGCISFEEFQRLAHV